MKITSDLFQAFLKCPTKCWLRAAGESGSGNAYAEWVKSQSASYVATQTTRLVSESPKDESVVLLALENFEGGEWRLATGIVVQAQLNSCTLECKLHAIERMPPEGRGRPAKFALTRFIFTNKLGKDDKLLLTFDALVLMEAMGRANTVSKIIHGDDRATLKVKTPALAGAVRKHVERIAAMLSSPTPPDLVLNRHCTECEFQSRCRQRAIEKDDLNHEELKKFKRLMPEVPVGVIFVGIPLGYAKYAQTIKAYSLHLSVEFANQEIVDDAHRRGLKVFCWTLEEVDEIERMRKLGIDGMFVNDLAFAHGVLTKR